MSFGVVDERDAATEAALEEFPYLAHDELMALEYADSEELMREWVERVCARRRRLDAFSVSRLEGMGWQHQKIQDLFNFLNLPLYTEED